MSKKYHKTVISSAIRGDRRWSGNYHRVVGDAVEFALAVIKCWAKGEVQLLSVAHTAVEVDKDTCLVVTVVAEGLGVSS